MSSWVPMSLKQLQQEVATGEARMDPQAARLWAAVRVEFVKWTQHPWGDEGNGFWVVGIIGGQVLWYNDIEDGFNWSSYNESGRINEYWCNKDELNHAIYALQARIQEGSFFGKAGPPESLPMPDA